MGDVAAALKAGDMVVYQGKEWVFVKDNGAMIEIGREGGTKMVYPHDIRPASNGGSRTAPAERDPFEELVPQLEGLLKRLGADEDLVRARMFRRIEQRQRLVKAIAVLKGEATRPAKAKRTAPFPCGHWPASKAHQACKAAEE